MINTKNKTFIFSLMWFFLSTITKAYSMQSSVEEVNFTAVNRTIPIQLKEKLLKRGVIIRVWSGVLHGGEEAGHVSLETAKNYISFWPDDDRSGYFMKDLQEDLNSEGGRDPENIIFLRHLNDEDLDGIHNNFNFLQLLLNKKKLHWRLHGEVQDLKPSFTIEAYNSGTYKTWSFNCASLVFNLLKNNNYVDKSFVELNTTITPDRVASICAKQFWYNRYQTNEESVIFKRLYSRLEKKGLYKSSNNITDFFLIDFFGRNYFKSRDLKVIKNKNLEKDVHSRIKKEKKEGLLWNSLGRIMDSRGVVGMVAQFLGAEQTISFTDNISNK